MASTVSSATAAQSGRQNGLYIPRLSYRTGTAQIPGNRNSINTMSTAVSTAATLSTVPTSPRYSTSTSMPSPGLLSDNSRSQSSQYSSDTIDSQYAKPTSGLATPPEKKEKKGGSFFNFLNTKEPSAQAFEEYQNAMCKKRGRATAVGMPGVSSAKLPPTVPKVNSKWDGVPQAAKEKTQRPSLSGSVRVQSREGTAGKASLPRSRADTAHGNGSGNRLAEIYGWDTASNSSSSVAKDIVLDYARPKKTPSTTTLPENTLFLTHPPLPVRSNSEQPPPPPLVSPLLETPPPLPELPAIAAPIPELSGIPSNRSELHGTSAPMPELPGPLSANRSELHAASADITAFTRYPPPPSCVSELESPNSPYFPTFPNSPPPRNPLRPPPLPELQGDILSDAEPPAYEHSPSLTPPERSPVTPGFSLDSHSLKGFSACSPDLSINGDLKTTVLSIPQDSEVIVRSSGINVLAPPAYARRPQYRLVEQQELFAADEDDEGAAPDDDDDEPQLHSILKWENTPRNVRPSLAKAFVSPDSTKESSPSAMSVRERLLGGSKASPVSASGSSLSDRDAERNFTPTPEGGAQSLRRKGRMRLFQK